MLPRSIRGLRVSRRLNIKLNESFWAAILDNRVVYDIFGGYCIAETKEGAIVENCSRNKKILDAKPEEVVLIRRAEYEKFKELEDLIEYCMCCYCEKYYPRVKHDLNSNEYVCEWCNNKFLSEIQP